MIGHGYPKVFGGLQHTVAMVSHLGLPGWLGYLVAGAEFFGGILVIAGLFTRVAALAICIDMVVAIALVHWKAGLLGDKGYQFPLSLAAMAFALIFFGGGPAALDALIWRGTARAKVRRTR
ncbi:MAG: DoxX family protein [Acidobacteriales bacterium]|nr:DoxX family protein [Terriglobales bacterium]